MFPSDTIIMLLNLPYTQQPIKSQESKVFLKKMYITQLWSQQFRVHGGANWNGPKIWPFFIHKMVQVQPKPFTIAPSNNP